MDLKADEISEILEFINQAEVFRPVVDKALDTIETFGPEFKKIADIFDNFRKYIVKGSIASFEEFQKAGFDREEAMLLTLDTKMAFMKMLNKNKDSKK